MFGFDYEICEDCGRHYDADTVSPDKRNRCDKCKSKNKYTPKKKKRKSDFDSMEGWN